ncbi:hypothetical protein Bca101_017046 [Brassica carinata]
MSKIPTTEKEKEKEKEAIRVLDPKLADAFYVPFFSSLSFNTHGKNMTGPDTELDRLLQVKVRRAWGMGKSYRSKRNRAASRVAEKDSFEASKEGTPSENSEVCYSK